MEWFDALLRASKAQILAMSEKYSARSTQYPSNFLQLHAQGSRIYGWNTNGNPAELIDFASGVGWYNLGHNHPALNAVLARFLSLPYANEPDHDFPNAFAAFLKRRLAEVTPGAFEKKVFLARGGAEAIECAIKICFDNRRWKWFDKVFVFDGAFHGRTGNALHLNRSKDKHWEGFIDPDARARSMMFPEAGPNHDCRKYLHDTRGELPIPFEPAVLFFEPVQGEGGIRVPCVPCLTEIIDLFRSRKALIVADEVQTGMGRTGTLFACEQFGIVPDVICLGKSLSPGFHLSATVFRADLNFKEDGRNSNTGVDVKACAVALEMIELLTRLDLTALKRRIQRLSTAVPDGIGMMRRISFETSEARDDFVRRAVELEPVGLRLLGAGHDRVRIMPSLAIPDEDLEEGINLLEKLRM